jgi:hypothetical protein
VVPCPWGVCRGPRSMGNAAPPIKRLREELHYECNVRSLLQVLCHVRRLVLEVHTDKAGHRLTWEWEVRKGADCRWRSRLGVDTGCPPEGNAPSRGQPLHRHALSLSIWCVLHGSMQYLCHGSPHLRDTTGLRNPRLPTLLDKAHAVGTQRIAGEKNHSLTEGR